jgi:hypothetical protein
MESSRVVEVLHDRGEAVSPRWLLGSGFVVKESVVVTAAHDLGKDSSEIGPEGTVVRCLDGTEYPVAALLARSDLIDLALLAVPDLKADPISLGRIDRERIEVVREVMAAGFPNYKYAEDRPKQQQRQPAQPVGSVATVEDLSGGDLTLKLESGEPAPVATAQGSPWEGLSGAGVIVGDLLLGIAIEHHTAEGLGALRFVPFTRLAELPQAERLLFCSILGIGDPARLPAINRPPTEVELPSPLEINLKEITLLEAQGLFPRGEAKALRILAYKKAKGWS